MNDVLDYVRKYSGSYTAESIRARLSEHGIPDHTIREAFQAVLLERTAHLSPFPMKANPSPRAAAPAKARKGGGPARFLARAALGLIVSSIVFTVLLNLALGLPKVRRAWQRLSELAGLSQPRRAEPQGEAARTAGLPPGAEEFQSYASLAFQMFQRNMLEESVRYASLALERWTPELGGDRNKRALLLLRAQAQEKLKDWGEAADGYEEALSLDPQDFQVLAARAFALAQSERHADALQAISRAIELAPREASYRQLRSQIYAALGKRDLAQTDSRQAQALQAEVPAPPAQDLGLGHTLRPASR